MEKRKPTSRDVSTSWWLDVTDWMVRTSRLLRGACRPCPCSAWSRRAEVFREGPPCWYLSRARAGANGRRAKMASVNPRTVDSERGGECSGFDVGCLTCHG